MSDKIRIAVDAMGGDNSPNKIIDGIGISLKKNTDNFFYLFGKKDLITKELNKYKSVQNYCTFYGGLFSVSYLLYLSF